MMLKLRKTYTVRVTVKEGDDEFWEALRGKSGADEVAQMVREALEARGFGEADGCQVFLDKFEYLP